MDQVIQQIEIIGDKLNRVCGFQRMMQEVYYMCMSSDTFEKLESDFRFNSHFEELVSDLNIIKQLNDILCETALEISRNTKAGMSKQAL